MNSVTQSLMEKLHLMSSCLLVLIKLILSQSSIAYHLLPDAKQKSADMMSDLRQEIERWKFVKCQCETNSLRGIRHLIELNSSHPIREGASLIYFIQKDNSSQDSPLFGSKQVQWLYHCCIGFKDIYLAKDWFIDLSYEYMANDKSVSERMVPKVEYVANIPCTVDAFVIPLKNLEYFINRFRFQKPVGEFLEMTKHLCLLFVLDPLYARASDLEKIESMLNRSVMLKFEIVSTICLPFKD